MRRTAKSTVLLLGCSGVLVAAYCALEWHKGDPHASVDRRGTSRAPGGAGEAALPLEAFGSIQGSLTARTAIFVDREGAPADQEDLSAVLRSLREALEKADAREVEALVNRAVSSFDEVLAHVSRLSEPGLELEDRENVLMLISLMSELQKAMRLDGVLHADLEAKFQRIHAQVLSGLGEYPREDADAILRLLAASQVLDESSLETLSGWLPHFKDSESFAELLVDLALRASPPRHDVVMDLVHHGEPGSVVTVAEKLAASEPGLSLDLALLVAKELPASGELWSRTSRLVATLSEPESAFDFLVEEGETRGWVQLLSAADALDSRGLQSHAFERYGAAENPETRQLLVLSATSDADFMEYVLETDESRQVRETALLSLSRKRADQATGALLLEAVAGILHPPAPGERDRSCSPQAMLWAVQNYWSKTPTHARGSATFVKLRSLLEEISQRSDQSEAVRAQALEVLSTLGA